MKHPLSLDERRERLAGLTELVAPVTIAAEQTLSLAPALDPLFPQGKLRRGTIISAAGSGGALSLALTVCAQASRDGSWLAVLGAERIGLAAVEEIGIALDRFVVVEAPPPDQWGSVAGALVDAFDLVLVATNHQIKHHDARRLQARARERGSVIVHIGRWGWPEAPDVRLDVIECQWSGLGEGHGILQARQLTVTAVARRDTVPRRKSSMWLPDKQGGVSLSNEQGGVSLSNDLADEQVSDLAEVS